MAKETKAIYYSEILEPKSFDILKDNGNGTVDIGIGKVLVVGKAKVVTVPAVGCVTLGTDVPDNLPELAEALTNETPKPE
jgi:hypothetical protein